MSDKLENDFIEIAILSIIYKKNSYGYEIIKDIKNKSECLIKLGESTLYKSLSRLQFYDLLNSYCKDGKKYYCITKKGIKIFNHEIRQRKLKNKVLKQLLTFN